MTPWRLYKEQRAAHILIETQGPILIGPPKATVTVGEDPNISSLSSASSSHSVSETRRPSGITKNRRSSRHPLRAIILSSLSTDFPGFGPLATHITSTDDDPDQKVD